VLARCEIAADVVAGRNTLTALRSEPPLTVRATAAGVHLVGSAAGPLGGDVLELDARVGPDATLAVRATAATLTLPGPDGAPSWLTTHLSVGAGGSLRWEPEPLVAVAGCDLRTTTRIDLGTGASLVWREELVWGRHGEPGGSVLARLVVDRAGRPLHRGDLALGPAWPGSLGPAGSDGARAVGVLLVVGAGVATHPTGGEARVAAMALGDAATLVLAVADRPGAVRTALDELTPLLAKERRERSDSDLSKDRFAPMPRNPGGSSRP